MDQCKQTNKQSCPCLPVVIAVVLFIPEFSLSLVVVGALNRRKRRGVSMFALWKTNQNNNQESNRGVSARQISVKRRLSVSFLNGVYLMSCSSTWQSSSPTTTTHTQAIQSDYHLISMTMTNTHTHTILPLSLLSKYSAASRSLCMFSTAVMLLITSRALKWVYYLWSQRSCSQSGTIYTHTVQKSLL